MSSLKKNGLRLFVNDLMKQINELRNEKGIHLAEIFDLKIRIEELEKKVEQDSLVVDEQPQDQADCSEDMIHDDENGSSDSEEMPDDGYDDESDIGIGCLTNDEPYLSLEK